MALIFVSVACNQSKPNSNLPKEESTSFIHDHIGNWEGKLQIYKKDSLIRELGMTFSFSPLKDSLHPLMDLHGSKDSSWAGLMYGRATLLKKS